MEGGFHFKKKLLPWLLPILQQAVELLKTHLSFQLLTMEVLGHLIVAGHQDLSVRDWRHFWPGKTFKQLQADGWLSNFVVGRSGLRTLSAK